VSRDRYAAARRIAERAGQVAVLKGAGTVVAEPSGRVAVCPLGTPALGTAGTGDVLAGAIGAALAASAPFEAACAMVLLHARAGEIAARTDRGLLAREVADRIPSALSQARRGGA
jgi:NAD(P)H-hydrate repair Nnr-like enzyme with NAD(P)H-hydrate dehydratase domain